MHELSIALSLIDLATEEGEKRHASVKAIHLRLGPLAGVDEVALTGAFELAREQSSISDARLVIDRVSLSVYCPHCDCMKEPPSIQHLVCPTCGSPTPEILTGKELQVFALEIADECTENAPCGSSPECAEAK